MLNQGLELSDEWVCGWFEASQGWRGIIPHRILESLCGFLMNSDIFGDFDGVINGNEKDEVSVSRFTFVFWFVSFLLYTSVHKVRYFTHTIRNIAQFSTKQQPGQLTRENRS